MLVNVGQYDVIIPAGGKIDDAFARVVDTPSKALIKFDGRTILRRTIEAFKDSGVVRKVAVIGPRALIESPDAQVADERLLEGQTGPENIYRGLERLSESGVTERVLICTADLPFISVEVIHQFLKLCPESRDFCVPLIAEEDFHELYPEAPATFVGLKEGAFTTGCLYNVNATALKKVSHHIDQVFLNRKSKMGMARLLGWRFVALMVAKRLTVKDVEDKVVEILGCSGSAVANSPAELAFDLDNLEDYHYATQVLRSVRRSPAGR